MSNTLIAVGGSGQSAAIAYLRMATLSGIPAERLPNLYVVDADVKDRVESDTSQPSLLGSLTLLFTQLTEGVASDRRPKLELIYPYYVSPDQAATTLSSSTTFGEYILGQSIEGAGDIRHILNALFSRVPDVQELSEQSLPLSNGFMARPNVGATTFFDKLHRKPMDRALQRLKTAVTTAQNSSVIVVAGSSFGGTGSGAAPALAQQLANWANQNNQPVRVGLFMTLPWFSPDGNKSKEGAKDTYGDPATQRANAAGGLRYYASSDTLRTLVDLFIADYDGLTHSRDDDSNSEQPEYEHVFNLMLAAQIQNYFLTKNTDPAFAKPGAYTFYYFREQGKHIHFDGGDSPLLGFSESPELRQDVKNWAYETQSLRLALKHVAEFLLRGMKYKDGSDSRDIVPAFKELALAVAKRDGRPNAITTAGRIFKKTVPANFIYENIAKKLHAREKQLADSIKWLSRLLRRSPELVLDDASLAEVPDRNYAIYPAMQQARTSEVAAVKLFEDAMKTARDILTPFEARINAKQDAVEAAVAEIEGYIRAAIRATGGVSKARSNDSVPGTIPTGCIIMPLVPMQIISQRINRYLTPISLGALVDDGNDRDGNPVTRLDNNHPASIAQLRHFNIPSPWGAALLESWRQDAAHDYRQQDPTLLKAVQDRIEAVLWGIFSKRLEIKSINAAQEGILGGAVVNVRNIELRQDANRTDSRVFVALHAKTGQLIAANYPTVGWFAASEYQLNHPQWWLEEDDFELPTETVIREKNTNTYALRQVKAFVVWIDRILAKQPKDSVSRAFPWYALLGKLSITLNTGLTSFKFDFSPAPVTSGNDAFLLSIPDTSGQKVVIAPLEVLSQSIDGILDEYCVNEVLVLQNDPDGPFQVPDSPLKSEYLGQMEAKLLKHHLITEVEVPYLQVEYQIDLPDFGAIQLTRKGKICPQFRVQAALWPNFKAPGWQFYYLGSTDSRATDDDQYRLAIFGRKDNGPLTALGITDPKVLTLHFGRNYELHGIPEFLVLFEKEKATSGKLASGYREMGAIQICLGTPKKTLENKHFCLGLDFGTSHSCVYATETNTARNVIPLDVSTPTRDLVMNVILFPPDGDKILGEGFMFLGCLSAKAAQQDHNVAPSEFKVLNTNQGEAAERIDNGIHNLSGLPMEFSSRDAEDNIKEYGSLGGFKWGGRNSDLTGSPFEGKFHELSIAFNKELLRKAFALLRCEGYSKLDTFRATFPESFRSSQIIEYARDLAVIIPQIGAETGINCTGLSQEGLLEFNRHASGETELIGSLSNTSHGLLSESLAALMAAQAHQQEAIVGQGLCMVLDMGGGSTDIAAYVPVDYLEGMDVPPSLTDSIRYAGHDVLEILAKPEIAKILNGEVPLIDTSPRGCIKVLKVAMRDKVAVRRLRLSFIGDEQFEPEVRQNIQLFYKGLFEYTRQLVLTYHAFLQKQNIDKWDLSVVLLGNAWRLADLVFEAHDTGDTGDAMGIIEAMEDYFQQHLPQEIKVQITFPSNHMFSVKQAIALGALKYLPTRNPFAGNGGKGKKAKRFGFAGLDLTNCEEKNQKPHRNHSEIIEECNTTQSVELSPPSKESPPVQTYEFIEEFTTQLAELKPPKVKDLNKLPTQPFIEELARRVPNVDAAKQAVHHINARIKEEWEEHNRSDHRLILSPMRYFLEEVWKPTILPKQS
ncbi:MAG: hypothetical protein WC091_02175 [Sulfuricellaceae bacterium]